jgi:hypothetical protein
MKINAGKEVFTRRLFVDANDALPLRIDYTFQLKVTAVAVILLSNQI